MGQKLLGRNLQTSILLQDSFSMTALTILPIIVRS
jgi:hypothetical protein